MAEYEKFSRFFQKRRGSSRDEPVVRRAPIKLLLSLREGPKSISELIAEGGLNYRELLEGLDVAKELGLVKLEGDDDNPTARLTGAGEMALRERTTETA